MKSSENAAEMSEKQALCLLISKTIANFAPTIHARMAESVDALVSNTSGAIRAGSTPAPGTDNG